MAVKPKRKPPAKEPGSSAASAVIRVGDGRGFVIAHERRTEGHVWRSRLVITAAHCLPHQPIVHGEPGWGEDPVYRTLLAPLGCEPAIWAECFFADPVGDIAVLGQPDNQTFGEQADAYDALVESAIPLKIAAPGKEGWLLSLDSVWFRCAVQMFQSPHLALSALEGNFTGGMSGSPIVSPEGKAIGIACLGGNHDPIGPNPSLLGSLPGWLLRRSVP